MQELCLADCHNFEIRTSDQRIIQHDYESDQATVLCAV